MEPFFIQLFIGIIVFVLPLAVVAAVAGAFKADVEAAIVKFVRSLVGTPGSKKEVRQQTLNLGVVPDCPRCRRSMVERLARRGSSANSRFWGCPQFPACRGTRPIDV